jgi:hypothetical protein
MDRFASRCLALFFLLLSLSPNAFEAETIAKLDTIYILIYFEAIALLSRRLADDVNSNVANERQKSATVSLINP